MTDSLISDTKQEFPEYLDNNEKTELKDEIADSLIENVKKDKSQKTQEMLNSLKNTVKIDEQLNVNTVNKNIDDYMNKVGKEILKNDAAHKNKNPLAKNRSYRLQNYFNDLNKDNLTGLDKELYDVLNEGNRLPDLEEKLKRIEINKDAEEGEYSELALNKSELNKLIQKYSNEKISWKEMPEFINTLNNVLNTVEDIEKCHGDINSKQKDIDDTIIDKLERKDNTGRRCWNITQGDPVAANIDNHVRQGEVDYHTGQITGCHSKEFLDKLFTDDSVTTINFPRKGSNELIEAEVVNRTADEIHIKIPNDNGYAYNVIKRNNENAFSKYNFKFYKYEEDYNNRTKPTDENAKSVMPENVIKQIEEKLENKEIEIVEDEIKNPITKKIINKKIFAVLDNKNNMHYFQVQKENDGNVSSFYPIASGEVNPKMKKYFQYMYSSKDIVW